MSRQLRWSPALLAAALLAAACGDPLSTAPAAAPHAARAPAAPPTIASVAAPACETITFDGFARGQNVTTVSLPGFGFSLTVSAVRYTTAGGAISGTAMAFDTDHVSSSNNDGTDMEWSGAFARCDDCQGLGRSLVVRRSSTSFYDRNEGGEITLAGFPDGYYLREFTVVDNDRNEPGVQYVLGGAVVATSTPLGDGAVEVVAVGGETIIPGSALFRFGRRSPFDAQSGGIDNLVVCQQAPAGVGCTRTIGYWKNHDGNGPQDDEITQHLPIWLGTPNGAESELVDDADQASSILSQDGGASNGIVKLRAQLLAAKLNLAAGASASPIAGTISAADTFLATHDEGSWAVLSQAEKDQVLSWHGTLDDYNNGNLGVPHCG